ncbi:hypothetical protein PM082_007280 [Marasmius tenuissimus]|nr:hypothetical protein PM082_007280 [Marasmius tenuissimus]
MAALRSSLHSSRVLGQPTSTTTPTSSSPYRAGGHRMTTAARNNQEPSRRQPSSPPQTLISPPTLQRRRNVPLPSQVRTIDIELHPLLQCHPRVGTGSEYLPPLNWDLSWPRQAVDRLLRSSSHPLAPYMRDPATLPSLPSMTVIHPQLPWPITVHSSNQSDEGVTIADVLLSIGCLMREMDYDGRGGTAGVEKLCYLDGQRKLLGFIKRGPDGDVWEMYTQ